ncbi:hypothetical protein [Cellulomonas sp. Marseille-Q8402]
MPRLTARQMFWTGLVLVLVGFASSLYARSLYDAVLWAAPEVFAVLAHGTSALIAVGAALLAGGLLVVVLQRGRTTPPAGTTGENPRPSSG